jgi:threonine dehydrogenase-like Zn-dependent dehydrogenase
MRAVRWYAARDLRLGEVPVPRVGPGQALVQVERVGLCGTDVEEYLHGPLDIPVAAPHPRSGHQAPLTPGHEVVGVVVDCPDDPSWVGRRVVPDVVEGCGTCWWCARHEEGLCPELVVLGMHAPGGLAELMVCCSATLVEVPAGVDADLAAFAEPTSVAVRAVAKAGDLRGATIAVVGAGVVGNLIAQVARGSGARVAVQEPSATRRDLVKHVGVELAVAGFGEARERLADLTRGRMADVVFECAGRDEAFTDAVALTRRGGTTVLVGLRDSMPPLPWRDIVLGEKRLLGTAAHMWDVDVATAVKLLADGIVDPRQMVSEVVPLSAVGAALERLAQPNELAKVLVDPARIGQG